MGAYRDNKIERDRHMAEAAGDRALALKEGAAPRPRRSNAALDAATRREEASRLLRALAPKTSDLGERGYMLGMADSFERGGVRAKHDPGEAYCARLRAAAREAGVG